MWNSRSSSQQLAFLYRVEEQKRHLIKLNRIKSGLTHSFNSSFSRSVINCSKRGLDLKNSYKVEFQNRKLFNRLLLAKPTINNNSLRKAHYENKNHKQNMIKSRYKYPDFTEQAKIMMQGKKNHLLRLNIISKSQKRQPIHSSIVNKSKFTLLR